MSPVPPSPEPKGVPPMFCADSWNRPNSETLSQPAKPPRREWPDKVNAKSFRAILGDKRLEEWAKACSDHDLNLPDLMNQAGREANNGPPHIIGFALHLDAKHNLRVLISDGIRDYLTAKGTPNAPRPILY